MLQLELSWYSSSSFVSYCFRDKMQKIDKVIPSRIQKAAKEGSVAILSKVSDKREFQLAVRREHVWEVVSPRAGKIIQISFRTGEGRKMRTDDFTVVSVDQYFVWLNEVSWNDEKKTFERKGSPFRVELEKVHFIMDGDLGIWPARVKRKG